MTAYRIGVQDPKFGQATLWYDQETYQDAYNVWRLLGDYGRDDITVIMQQRTSDGWTVIPQPTIDWVDKGRRIDLENFLPRRGLDSMGAPPPQSSNQQGAPADYDG